MSPISIHSVFLLTRCRRIYYIAIAFSAIAFIAAMFVRDVTHNMTDHVAVTLQNDHTEQEKKSDVEGRS